MATKREHLFINYAKEDGDLAVWLTLKLTAGGYRVWCDRYKLLGGESYPTEIDDAIKNQTFRMISILSHASVHKPNPKKERTLGLSLAQERKEDFIIPLNVNLSPTELPWTTSDITYIPFENWASGLKQLLEKLESINAPKTLVNGEEIAANTFLPVEVVVEKQEVLHLNCLKILQIPQKIKCYQLEQHLTPDDFIILKKNWAYWKTRERFIAFTDPPKSVLAHVKPVLKEEYDWSKNTTIYGINSANLVSFLLKQSLYTKCYQKGLFSSDDGVKTYFPLGLIQKDKIFYTNFEGKKTHLKVAGIRNNKSHPTINRYSYHIAPEFFIRRDISDGFTVQFRIRLHILGPQGEEFPGHSAQSRRKKITKGWWNDKWFNVHLAVLSFLSDGQETITLGESPNEQIIVSSKMPQFTIPYGINEAILSPPVLEDDFTDPEHIEETEEESDNT